MHIYTRSRFGNHRVVQVIHVLFFHRPAAAIVTPLIFCASLALSSATLHAALTVVGDVTPTYTGSDPWDPYHSVLVGNTTDGSISIDNGSVIEYTPHQQKDSYLGYGSGTLGTAEVEDIGSLWSVGRHLYIGHDGAGVLGISNGGTVEVFANTWTEHMPGGTGQVNFDNGVLNTGGLLASPAELLGVGTINATATVTDADLVFDAISGTTQQVIFNDLPGQNITLNIELGPQRLQSLGAGYRGVGTLRIADGLDVQTGYGHIGYHAGADGAVTVSESLWDARGLYVGVYGSGLLDVESTSTLRSYEAYIGEKTGSSGTVNISGSFWENNTEIYVGESGLGELIVDGGGGIDSNYLLAGVEPGSSGDVQIMGAGTSVLAGYFTSIGAQGAGTLEILDQGEFITGDLTLAVAPGSSGDAIISGDMATMDIRDDLIVGKQAAATLTISDGGLVTVERGFLGYEIGGVGNAVVDGPGSVWESEDGIAISGESGLQVHNGGEVRGGGIKLLESTGSPGLVSVDGPGSIWDTTSVSVHGSRVLRISQDAEVHASRSAAVGTSTTSEGTINFDQGVLRTATLFASDSDLRGVGEVFVEGVVADRDIIFDSSHGLQQQWVLNSLPGQSITVHMDATNPSGLGSLGAGYVGVGSIRIADGLVVSSNAGYLGYAAGSEGTATVSGVGSTWHSANREWSIGREGSGLLVIEHGGLVSGRDAYLGYIGQDASGSILVHGNGSALELTTNLIIGYQGTGTLVISDGGVVQSNGSYIGEYLDSHGEVSVSGAGSTWSAGFMVVGRDGSAELIIDNQGKVEVGSQITLGGYGILHLADGLLSFSDKMFGSPANPRDPLPHTYGDFLFTGGRLEAGWLISLNQPLSQDGGVFAIENANNRTDIIGDYLFNAGTLEIDLGIAPGAHEIFTTTGDIDIALTGTTLDLPALGAMAAGTYTVIESTNGTLTGTFEHITGLGIHPGLIDVNYTTNAVTVTLNWDYLPGDLNADGFVGIDDLNVILVAWNQNVTQGDLASGDLSGDGFVGINDLTTVLGNWNTSVPPPVNTSNAIPEPASLGLLAMGVACGLTRRQLRCVMFSN